ncbi:MAG: phosphate acyltransferase [Hallella sp.]|uniref:phosphate acyltransferase n=1 Tax=Hallella sp. TaxID=2980186 RepID=UPI002E77B8E5|nr:phosphate acyltransferase [Hallella sp.]MED9946557.1 phosphate acyltransferase [Hallella sp.]
MPIKSFDELIAHLKTHHLKKRVAAVCPNDESSHQAIANAERDGIITPLVFQSDDPAEAARQAVEAVRRGEADVIMKGFVNTDVLLRAILNKETGILRKGRVMTHITLAQLADYHKLLFFTDAAVIPYPTQEQRVAQIQYVTHYCQQLGIERPRISLIHCSEKVDAKNFPFTAGYGEIKEMAAQGAFGPCIIDGPLDLKTSCSKESMAVKHIDSPIAGDADALIFPDIEAGNLFYKTITLFCQARTAGVLQGPDVPVVLPSRGDSAESKYLSLCLACLL